MITCTKVLHRAPKDSWPPGTNLKQVKLPISHLALCVHTPHDHVREWRQSYGRRYTHLHASHAKNGMIPWWMTCNVLMWLSFFLSTKKNVSKNSVNLEMKYHLEKEGAVVVRAVQLTHDTSRRTHHPAAAILSALGFMDLSTGSQKKL